MADDLLKNDGQKFLEMMEQLATRRLQREAELTTMLSKSKDYDDEYEDEDADDYEDEEEEDLDEEDEEEVSQKESDFALGCLADLSPSQELITEEQRMEEGRRMFQIFAARMFEQRVLQAYRERVAQDRQLELLRELEEEENKEKDREAKRAKENQKKKDKKK